MQSSKHGSEGGESSSASDPAKRLTPDAAAAGRKGGRRRPKKSKKKKPPTHQDSSSPVANQQAPSPKKGNDEQWSQPKKQPKSPPQPPPRKEKSPADMTVIVNRVNLFDTGKPREERAAPEQQHHHNDHSHVAPYHFGPDVSCWVPEGEQDNHQRPQSVAVMRVPQENHYRGVHPQHHWEMQGVVDNTVPNPHPSSEVHDKYWAQRRRLFSRFDMGILLDAEGWYSVTPEVIADHVAQRVGELSNSTAFRRGLPGSDISASRGIVVLDAFCGCGGNSIAFGKLPPELISLVVSVDIDRTKLRMAAHNASLYGIPLDKIMFVECNTMFIIEHCYKDGDLVTNVSMPPPVLREMYAGYLIGGLELLPERIDAVFMDPPWGGVDYGMLGKHGYDLEKNMKIRVGDSHMPEVQVEQHAPSEVNEHVTGVADDFFDSFSPGPSQPKTNAAPDECEGEFVNGVDLLKMAAAATRSRLVIYDLPRNTNNTSLGRSALAAGYRGNLKLEEHYLNDRLKTVTAYMGADYGALLH